MIKKRLFKYGSVFMCAAVLACSLGVYGITSNSNTTETQDVTAAQVSAGNDSESIISNAISSQLANATKATSSTTNSKEETVYVFANAKGAQDHVLVNEKLRNVTGLSSISDVSKLKNIVNVSGDETSSTGSNNALTWNASGNSITYQGTTTEKAPITMKITYLLDGKEITPENLAGKSGKVTIRYEYTNNEKKTVTVNGKSYTVAVPFTMMTGMVLPSDKFSNIEVTNGKISELSDSNVVLGITMPGLKDTLSLKFDSETLDMDIPEYFEVTADVKDFELDMSMSVATSNLLSDANVDDLSLDSLKGKMTELQDAADQLTDGTATLQDGTQTLADSLPTLTSGVAQLDDGATSLVEGTAQLAEGGTTLNSGVAQLIEGFNAYADGVTELQSGAGKLNAATNGGEVNGVTVTGLHDSLVGGMNQAQESYKEAYTSFYSIMSLAIANHIITDTTVLQEKGLTSDVNITQYAAATMVALQNYEAMNTATVAALSSDSDNALRKAAVAQVKATNPALSDAQAIGYVMLNARTLAPNMITTIVSGLSQAYSANSVLNQIYTPLVGKGETDKDNFFNGMKQVAAGLSQLNTKSGEVKAGLTNLSAGTTTLSAGLNQLASKSVTLKEGTSTLNSASVTLGDGVTELNNGAITLKDGMAEFNETGIKSLTSLVGTDADTALDTLKAVVKAGQEYQSFGGKSDDMEGSVTFIYKTDGITK